MVTVRELVQKSADQYAWLVIAVTLVITIIAGLGLGKLYFRGDYRIFFEDGYQPYADFEEMRETFSKNDNIAILVVPDNGSLASSEMMQLISEYTEEAWQIPYSSRVDSLTNFQHTRSEDDDMLVEDLVSEDLLSQLFTDAESSADSEASSTEIDRIFDIAAAEPILNGSLVDEQRRVSLINVVIQLPESFNQTPDVTKVVNYVEQLSQQFKQKYPDVSFYHTGVLPMNNSFASEGRKDMATLIPVMLLLIIVLLTILLRSVVAMCATLILLFMTLASTMGLGGWFGYFLSTATLNVPIIVLTIAVADCVHLASTAQFALSRGMSKIEAIKHSIELNWMPVLITSFTTAVGFLTLTLSESPAFVDFGVLSAVGVLFACFYSLTIFPALLRVLPIKALSQTKDQFGMEALANFVIRKNRLLLFVSGSAVILMGGLALTNTVNDVATEYFSDKTEFRQSVNVQEANLSGSISIQWSFATGVSGDINEPVFIKTLDDFANWLREQPEVDHVSSLSDTYKRLNKNMHSDDPEWYRIPEDRELAAQYMLLYEMSLPYGLDLNNQIDIDKSAVKITSILKNLGSQQLVSLEDRAKQWVQENASQYRLTAASPALMFAHIGETNMDSMLISMILAMFIISGLMIFALRSLRLGLISLLPNLTPAMVGFGFWALISGEINLGLSVVASMTLGIIVDDSVHFLSKYKWARNNGLNTEDAIRYAFANVGRALVITTVVLVLGFFVLTFSAFRLNSDMGLATAIIIFVALVIDFLLLPPILLLIDKKKENTDITDTDSTQSFGNDGVTQPASVANH